ncbi:hypothetical protein [Streptomyces pinistramenti]|uniref:hypothetical protein n=1 Tax=Streptomyces pinistramenti TaxID=2884812 RepID=UPI001D097ED6|nr:hypothetical protein [Streptomyces pinistramenti]MCB5911682.1 hypothetical protein [Streptomyces pinistramenti]
MTDRAPHPPSGPATAPGTAPRPVPGTPPAPHHTSTTERGSFILASCTCGWHGAARRARSQARTDAERHLAAAGPHPA